MSQAITTPKITNVLNHAAAGRAEKNILTAFLSWCEQQEDNRFLWLGITFFGLIGIAVPGTLFAVLVFGANNFNLWILTCALNSPVLAITLAAQPTKVTLPALFFALLVDAIIVVSCVITYLLF
ncbi:hypothetical protein EXU57_09465 [Segetibacter sp. 3557_3]|uniref:hypothetical protein n=1 Tax=Segetibacter sp. 3557_3 TaxID=2547429 RepID=UPI001058985A|nr:hypothetical protein [Segetibacter sp. 3557_3]TDH27019.1 hypothetical protein EXU57_09465 [Segetibacter sp. 3557_3]